MSPGGRDLLEDLERGGASQGPKALTAGIDLSGAVRPQGCLSRRESVLSRQPQASSSALSHTLPEAGKLFRNTVGSMHSSREGCPPPVPPSRMKDTPFGGAMLVCKSMILLAEPVSEHLPTSVHNHYLMLY